MSSEGLWSIGTVGMVPELVVVKNNFRNVPRIDGLRLADHDTRHHRPGAVLLRGLRQFSVLSFEF